MNTTSPKIDVWAGIYENYIISPFFILGNLSGEIHPKLFDNTIDPTLVQVLENEENQYTIIFQRDAHHLILLNLCVNFYTNFFFKAGLEESDILSGHPDHPIWLYWIFSM